MGRDALSSFAGPRLRAHLLTTRKWAVVLPAAAVRSPRVAPLDAISLPSITDQQTPLAACASDGAASMHWGLGGH